MAKTIVDVFNNIFEYKNEDIILIINDDKIPWFYGKQIAKILGYTNTNLAIINHVDNINKTTYDKIKEFSKTRYNLQIIV
jgi:prophage antirepressor-like protein